MNRKRAAATRIIALQQLAQDEEVAKNEWRVEKISERENKREDEAQQRAARGEGFPCTGVVRLTVLPSSAIFSF